MGSKVQTLVWTQHGAQLSALAFGNTQGLDHQIVPVPALSLQPATHRSRGRGGLPLSLLSHSDALSWRILLCAEDSKLGLFLLGPLGREGQLCPERSRSLVSSNWLELQRGTRGTHYASPVNRSLLLNPILFTTKDKGC